MISPLFILHLAFDSNNMRDGDFIPIIKDILFEVPNTGSGRNCWPHCVACTQVTIQDDSVLEEQYESFSLVLNHEDPAVHLTSTQATVTIIDNDGKFTCGEHFFFLANIFVVAD